MNKFLLTFTTLILSIALINCKPLVIPLEEEELHEYVLNNEIVFALIYTTYFKRFASNNTQWFKLMDETANKSIMANKPTKFIKINSYENHYITHRLDVSQYPSFRLAINGSFIDYNGKRTPEALLAFVEEKLKLQSILLTTHEELEFIMYRTTGTRCVLASDKQRNIRSYFNLARPEEGVKFYHAPVQIVRDLLPEGGKEGNVVMLRDFDKENVVLPKLNESEFARFIKIYKKIYYHPCSAKAYRKVLGSKKKDNLTGYFLFRSNSQHNLTQLEHEFNIMAAYKLREGIDMFISTDINDAVCNDFATKRLNLKERDLPLLIAIKADSIDRMSRWRYNKSIWRSKELMDFYEAQTHGGIDLQGEDEPLINNGPVYTIVGKTFERDVIKANTSVLVKFYAPWCGHCKKLAPIFEELAMSMKNNKKIKFAEIDSTKNSAPGHQINAYPTLKLFLEKDKENAIQFSGKNTFEAIKEFIEKNLEKQEMRKDL